MTVSTLTNRVVYTGNGATTQFAVPFKVLDIDHLVVQRRVAATDAVEYTYVGTDFSYAGLGDDAGTLTLNGAALAGTYELVIERTVPYTQELDLVNAGGFYPETVEEQLDLMVMQIQQVAARPDILTSEALMQAAENATQAAFSIAASAATATSAAANAAVLAAASNHADMPAKALAPIDETQIIVLDATTSHADNLFIRDDVTAANDHDGTLDAFIPGTAFNVGKNVVNQAGNTVAVAAGDVPYDWSTGIKRIKVKSTDLFAIPDTEFTFSTTTTVVADFVLGAGDGTLLELSDGTHFIYVACTAGVIQLQVLDTNGTDPDLLMNLAEQPAADTVLEVALRLEAGVASVSLNGEPWRTANYLDGGGAGWVAPDSFTPTTLKICQTTNDFYLGRLRLVSRAVPDAEFQSLFRSHRPAIVASRALGLFRDSFGTDSGDRYREPNIIMFDDGAISGQVVGVATSMNRYGVGTAGEMPARIVGWPFSHDEESGTIELGARFEIYRPELWSSAKGHSQSLIGCKGKVGANRGKTFIWVHDYLGDIAGSVIGDMSTLNGSIRFGTSEKNLTDVVALATDAFWTTVYQAGVGSYAVPGPCEQPVELPDWHTFAGRIGFSFYTPVGLYMMYRTPAGAHAISSVATGTPVGYAPTEGASVPLPNGDILVFARMTAANVVGIYRSLAAAPFQSLVFEELLEVVDGYEGADVGLSAFQLDLEGKYGPIGRIGLVRALRDPSGSPPRMGNKLSHFEDADFSLRDEEDLLMQLSQVGYSTAVPIFGGRRLMLALETAQVAFNERDYTHLMSVEPNSRAVGL